MTTPAPTATSPTCSIRNPVCSRLGHSTPVSAMPQPPVSIHAQMCSSAGSSRAATEVGSTCPNRMGMPLTSPSSRMKISNGLERPEDSFSRCSGSSGFIYATASRV
jgi:hypothetical protein